MIYPHGGHLLKDLYGAVQSVLNQGGCNITYLLDMVFSDYANDAGPLASPYAGRTGSLTLIQNDGQFSINSGKLAFTVQATPVWGDLGFYSTGQTRAAGLTLFAALTLTTWEECGLAWHSAAAVVDPDNTNNTQQAHTVNGRIDNVTPISIITGLSSATEYPLILVARSEGAFLWIRINDEWQLLWVDNTGTTTTIYALFSLLDAVGTLSAVRTVLFPGNATYPVEALGIRDLDKCAPGTGSGTSTIAAPAVNNTFIHTPDAVVKFTFTTLPTANFVQVQFRRTDDNNCIRFQYFQGSNTLSIIELSGGATISSDSGVGLVNNGDTIHVKLLGTSVGVYVNSNLVLSLTASTGISTPNGNVRTLGTGGVLANLTARTIDGMGNVSSSNHPGYGLATYVLPGPRSNGDTFTHEADGIIEFIVDALDPVNPIYFRFRIQDATNYWDIVLFADGRFYLREIVGGGTTNRGTTAAGAVTNGSRITLNLNGPTIKGYVGTSLKWTYASAINFQTETDGLVYSLSANGHISNVIAWPLNLSSAPNTVEAITIKDAFDCLAVYL